MIKPDYRRGRDPVSLWNPLNTKLRSDWGDFNFLFEVLGIKPRVSHMLDKHHTQR